MSPTRACALSTTLVTGPLHRLKSHPFPVQRAGPSTSTGAVPLNAAGERTVSNRLGTTAPTRGRPLQSSRRRGKEGGNWICILWEKGPRGRHTRGSSISVGVIGSWFLLVFVFRDRRRVRDISADGSEENHLSPVDQTVTGRHGPFLPEARRRRAHRFQC